MWSLDRFAHGKIIVLAHKSNEGRPNRSRIRLERTNPRRQHASSFARIRGKRRGKPIRKLIHYDLSFKEFNHADVPKPHHSPDCLVVHHAAHWRSAHKPSLACAADPLACTSQ